MELTESSSYWIKAKNRSKATWTKGERDFQEFLDSRMLEWEHDVTMPFTVKLYHLDGQEFAHPFDFQMDFVRRTPSGSIDLDIEIDGKGHKDKWDRWKDGIKNAQGVKVLHIGAGLCRRKFWPDLDRLLTQALQSKEATVYLDSYAR